MSVADAIIVALGLAVGAFLGAVSVARIRGRRGRPEIRLTITRDALPARGGTPNTGGPGDFADDGGIPMHVAGGRDPLLEQILAGGNGAPRARTFDVAATGAEEPFSLGVPALATVGARRDTAESAAFALGTLDGTRAAPGDGRLEVGDAPAGVSGAGAAQPDRAIARMDHGDPSTGHAAGMAESGTGHGTPGASDVRATGGPRASGPQPAPDSLAGQDARPLEAGPPEEPSGDAATAASVPCAEERRLVAERCSVATRAHETHQIAHDAFRATQREYDRTVESVERARKVVDGRRILDEKSEAQRRFRAARLGARTAAEIELAAGTWLHDVNRINAAVRQGNVQLAHGRERTSQLVVELERLSARVDAARIAAATAEQDCHAAREALAACEEARSGSSSVAALQAQSSRPAPDITAPDGATSPAAAAPSSGTVVRPPSDEAPATPTPPAPAIAGTPLTAPAGPPAAPPGLPPVAPPVATPAVVDDAMPLGRAPYGATPMILRILRGDREALDRVVTVLAAGSDGEARRWHLDLGALVDAIVAAAIDAAVLDLPQDHAFWGTFSPAQARQVAGVLGGLGSRYDGRGGFADGRVPSARDLALAVGYTGMDPRRVRHWPNEAQMAELYRGVAVAADSFVAEGAPDMTLGQMVGLLGRHAETLTALWDEWGRVRPLLLAVGS